MADDTPPPTAAEGSGSWIRTPAWRTPAHPGHRIPGYAAAGRKP